MQLTAHPFHTLLALCTAANLCVNAFIHAHYQEKSVELTEWLTRTSVSWRSWLVQARSRSTSTNGSHVLVSTCCQYMSLNCSSLMSILVYCWSNFFSVCMIFEPNHRQVPRTSTKNRPIPFNKVLIILDVFNLLINWCVRLILSQSARVRRVSIYLVENVPQLLR